MNIPVSIKCKWCDEENEFFGRPLFCWSCGHRADLPPRYCDCVVCRHERFEAEMAEREKHNDD
jgi:hypothetical protein